MVRNPYLNAKILKWIKRKSSTIFPQFLAGPTFKQPEVDDTDLIYIYPLVNSHIAIENGPVEIVNFPIKNGGSFHSYVAVYQAG